MNPFNEPKSGLKEIQYQMFEGKISEKAIVLRKINYLYKSLTLLRGLL